MRVIQAHLMHIMHATFVVRFLHKIRTEYTCIYIVALLISMVTVCHNLLYFQKSHDKIFTLKIVYDLQFYLNDCSIRVSQSFAQIFSCAKIFM